MTISSQDQLNDYVRAAFEGDLDKVKKLLNGGMNIRALFHDNKKGDLKADPLLGMNALDAAIAGALERPEKDREKHIAVINLLKERGLSIDEVVHHHKNRLADTLSKIGYNDIDRYQCELKAKFLISIGADPFYESKTDDVNSPINEAIRNAPDFAVDFIINNPAKVTPQHAKLAAYHHRAEVLQEILGYHPEMVYFQSEHPAGQLQKKDKSGLLHTAIVHSSAYSSDPTVMAKNQQAKVDTVALILKRAPQLVNVPFNGKTPLHYAAKGSSMVLEELIKAEADVNAQDVKGNTPAHIAAESGTSSHILDMLKLPERNNLSLLLQSGADLTIPNKDGQTVRQIAQSESRRGKPAALEVLNQFEALGKATQAAAPIQEAINEAGSPTTTESVKMRMSLGKKPGGGPAR